MQEKWTNNDYVIDMPNVYPLDFPTVTLDFSKHFMEGPRTPGKPLADNKHQQIEKWSSLL